MPYRPTEKTERRRAAVREAILVAAIDQLAQGGYASATIQAVAARAGVATGTVYRHFHSKGHLFAEVFKRASGRELQAFADALEQGETVHERVAAGIEAFARRALAQPTRAFALLAEPVDPAVEAERLVYRRGYRDVLAAVLRDGIDSGELAAHDPEIVAAALVGGLAEALVGPLSRPPRNAEALIAAGVQFCSHALPVKEQTHVHAHAHANA
jgi:AcrR family transcriptional regulator